MSPVQSVAYAVFRYMHPTLVCLCMLVLSPLAAQAHDGPQRVLILHSYHQGLAWTDDVHAALTTTLAQGGLPLDVHVKYLDATRLADPKAFRRNVELLHQQLVDEFAGKPFDLVLVSDNPALDFVLEHREPLTGNAPVVFCGINNFSPDHLRGQPDVTGVAEMPSFDATVDLALKLRPKASKLLVLAEETPTGKANQALLLEQSARFSRRFEIEVVKETDIYKLEARLAELGPEWIVLPMVRPRDEHGALSAAEASQRLSRASTVPLIAAWDFWMGHGPALGVVVSAKHQGGIAAAMAIQILRGERAESIPVVRQENNVVMADALVLTRFGMSERLLPEGAEMLNAPVSFYAVNKGLFWTGGVIGLCLLLLSLSLARNVSRRKRAEELYRDQLGFVETLLQTIPAPVFFKDVKGRYLGVNPAFETLMGKPAKDFIGRSPEEAFPQEHGQVFAQRDREIQKLGDTQRYEHVMPTALGLRSLTITKAVYPGKDGSPAGIVGILMDITERAQLVETLIRNDALLEAILRNLPFDFWARDTNQRMILQSDESIRMWGDLSTTAITDTQVESEYLSSWMTINARVLHGELDVRECAYTGPEGDLRQYHAIVAPIRHDEEILGILGINIDITGRKKAEQALRDSERFLKSTQAIARIGSWRLDLATNQVVWTEELYRMYGLDPALPPPPYTEHMKLFSPASWELLATSLANTRDTGIPYELELETVRKDGSNGWMWVRGEAARDTEGNITSIWGAAQDITERKRADDALRESELRFKTLHNASFGGITIHEKGRILECNQGLSDISGYAYEELIGMDGLLLIAEQSRELVMANILSGYEKPYEAYGLRKNGEVYPLRLEARNIPYQGRTVRVVEFRDITESRLAQQALEQEALRRRILMEKSLDGIVIIDQEHRVVEANERFASMLGYSQEEVVGLYTWDYEAVASEADIRTNFSDLSAVSSAFETRHRRKDGSLLDVEVSLSGASVAGKPLVFAVCRDITDRKRAEEEKRQEDARLRKLLEILQSDTPDTKTLLDIALGKCLELTGSRYGYIYHYDEDSQQFTLNTWSRDVMKACSIANPDTCYSLSKTGIWGEAVRQRRAIIVNDFKADNPLKRGYPEGHASLTSFMTVPIVSSSRIVAVVGVANKQGEYTEREVLQLTLLMDATWRVLEKRRAEETLRVSEERLALALEAAEDGLWDWDVSSGVAYFTPRYYTMLGYLPGDFPGTFEAWKSLLHPDDAEITLREIAGKLETAEPFEIEFRMRTKSGGWTWILARGKVVEKDAEGRAQRMVGTHVDITERKRAEDELRYANKRLTALWSISSLANADFKAICNHILHMIVEMTGSRFGFYGFVNQVESEMTIHSWSGEAMEGCTVLEKPAHFLISHAGVWGEAVRKRRPFILNDYSEAHPAKKGCPSGHVQLENLLVVPFFSAGRIISVAAVANRFLPYTQEDVEQITSFLTGTQAIVERMQALEELTLAKDAAESANRAKSEFLANMSHEIRTPLNGVLGMLQLIQASEVSGDVESYAEMGIRAGRRLTTLLNDILDLSRIEAGHMSIVSKPFALADIFTALAETFSPMHYSKLISLVISASPDLPADVVGDEIRVRQILFNLVGNAMKFTDKGEVRVEVSRLLPLPSGQARLLFVVSDTGLGIPDEKVSQICAPFVQAASDFTRSHQGAGLGLSIAKKLIDAMGGTLTFESTEGQGTSVYLTLPAGISEDSAIPDAPGSVHDAEAGASLRLLLVEDEEISRLSVRLHLEKLGHQVFTANNGEEAIEALRAGRYDCVLMDIQMDVLDGVAATRAIRSGFSGVLDAQVPIVAMTAYAMAGDRERFLEAGMNDYVAKPVQVEELKKALARVIGKNCQAECSQQRGDCPGQE